MRKKNFYLILITILGLLVVGVFSASEVRASNEPAIISGYAWSPNVGWIDMEGVECAVPANTSGSCNIQGYAWSPNVGWVQFGNLSSFPSALGYSQVNSKINFTSNDGPMDGWFRAWSLITSSSGNNDNEFDLNGDMAEGADGWASLRGGAVHSVDCGPLVMNTEKECSGEAWGSEVLGWVDFSKVKVKYPEPKLILQALGGGGQYSTQSPRTISFSPTYQQFQPKFRWTSNTSYLIQPGQNKCYLYRSTNGQMAQKVPVDLPPPANFNLASAVGIAPVQYNGTGVSIQAFFTPSDCGSYNYQLECAGYGIGSTGEPATVFSNEIVFNVCGNPSIDVVGGCSVVNFNGATNVPANTSCSGISGISSVPSMFPANYNVSPGSYTLTCGAASKHVDVYGPTSPQCSANPGGGPTKQPNWKEN